MPAFHIKNFLQSISISQALFHLTAPDLPETGKPAWFCRLLWALWNPCKQHYKSTGNIVKCRFKKFSVNELYAKLKKLELSSYCRSFHLLVFVVRIQTYQGEVLIFLSNLYFHYSIQDIEKKIHLIFSSK